MGSSASVEFYTAYEANNALEAARAASSAALSGSPTKAPGFAGGYLLINTTGAGFGPSLFILSAPHNRRAPTPLNNREKKP